MDLSKKPVAERKALGHSLQTVIQGGDIIRYFTYIFQRETGGGI
jgi:hypothetical protein